jgi:hypothetical protein
LDGGASILKDRHRPAQPSNCRRRLGHGGMGAVHFVAAADIRREVGQRLRQSRGGICWRRIGCKALPRCGAKNSFRKGFLSNKACLVQGLQQICRACGHHRSSIRAFKCGFERGYQGIPKVDVRSRADCGGVDGDTLGPRPRGLLYGLPACHSHAARPRRGLRNAQYVRTGAARQSL